MKKQNGTIELPMAPAVMITITQEQIDTALVANSGHCMISDSIKRTQIKYHNSGRSKGVYPIRVSTDLQTIRFNDPQKGVRYIYLTPTVAQKALLQFDQGIEPTPFKFRLRTQGSQTIPSLPRSQRNYVMKAKVVVLKKKHGKRGPNSHVTKLGGKSPKMAVLAGTRRVFGLRCMGDLNGPTDLTIQPPVPALRG